MQHPIFMPTVLALVLAGFGHLASAAGEPTLPEITVSSGAQYLTGIADTASEGSVSAQQLANRPLLRPAEVLEAVPGMIVTQHSGDGKANQYFLRGFNLDHGSDFATSLMGMPVNMLTHAHGQGYMDLNFLIPELVASVKYRKGVYAAEDGDLAVTGSARIDYQRRLERSFIDLGLGQNGYKRFLAAGSLVLDGRQLLAALELAGNDGPWAQPEKLSKTNAVLRLSDGNPANGYALTAMLYQAEWTATEHVPERAIASGEIGRYGALSARDGGQTHRYSLSADWARSAAYGALKANLYVLDYGLNYFANPSGYIGGAAGDQHEQVDERTVFGGELRRTWLLGPAWRDTELSAGLQLCQDEIHQLGLYSTEERRRTSIIRSDRVSETSAGFFVEARSQWTPWLRSTLGLRRDEISAKVTPTGGQFNMDNGGNVHAGQSSPKVGVVFGPFELFGQAEFYANWGHGFHSNDMRGATARTNPQDGTAAAAVPLLVKAKGSEIGMRSQPLAGWQSSLSLWQMDLASELVFVGDAGITEPKGASRRHGLEWSNDLSPAPGWLVDADLALAQARFKVADPVSGGGHVPNAIPLTASLAVTADPGGRWFGGVRLRYLGAYALEETATRKSTPFCLTSLKAGYRLGAKMQLTLDILNLFNKKANDIEYWGGACTRSETLGGSCGGGIDGRLVHPLEPRSLRVGMRLSF